MTTSLGLFVLAMTDDDAERRRENDTTRGLLVFAMTDDDEKKDERRFWIASCARNDDVLQLSMKGLIVKYNHPS